MSKQRSAGFWGGPSTLAGGVKGGVSRKEFEGLSQEATATALQGDRDCRERVFSKLVDKLSAAQPQPTPVIPDQSADRIELFLVSTSETQLSVVVRNRGNEGVLLSLQNLRIGRIGNSDFSNSFLIDLDHDGVYVQPGKEEKLVAGFKSEVSAPLCRYMHQQAFFKGFEEIKDRRGTYGEAMQGVSDKIACDVGLHETSFNSPREFYFRPFDCGNFQLVNSCVWTEMNKVFSK